MFMYINLVIPHTSGFKECWGKSCHTSELPFVFESMDIIQSNYSMLGPFAQQEALESREISIYGLSKGL